MSLPFENRSSFDALRFDQVDPFGDEFHVFVVRIGYSLGPVAADGHAALTAREEPAALVVEGEYFGEILRSSVRAESDLAPYKPLCDVLVNGSAHAPAGKPRRQVEVRLVVKLPDQDVPLPARPQGLNPYMASLMTFTEASLLTAIQTIKVGLATSKALLAEKAATIERTCDGVTSTMVAWMLSKMLLEKSAISQTRSMTSFWINYWMTSPWE